MRKGVGVPLDTSSRRFLAPLLVALVCVALVACGGGGGGGGGNSVQSTSLTLSGNSASFSAMQGGTVPASQSFTITVTGDTTAVVGASLASGQSQASWLTFSVAGSGSNHTLTVGIAQGSLSVGQSAATIVISAADATGKVLAQANFSVSLSVVALVTLSATPNALSFGGADGRAALTAVPLVFTLSSGAANYPFAIATSTTSGGQWLTVDHASGTVGSTGQTVNVGINPAGLHGGRYAGQLSITVNAAGTSVVQSVPVSLVLEANRLVVTASGVGFSKVGGRSVLTRTVHVLNSLGRTDVPWTATSDSAWLSATASGVTGGNLVLTANNSGLPKDITQFANITIVSSDPTVENQQSIRVGLFVSDTAATTTALARSATNLASSPVEPIVAISQAGTSVDLYNVYSGSLVKTLAGVAAAAGQLAFSEDGRTLFVFDTTNIRVNQIDMQSGSTVAAYDASQLPPSPFTPRGNAFTVMHPDGYPMLITASGRNYDLASGAQLTGVVAGLNPVESFATSQDQTLIAAQDGYVSRVVRSSLNGAALVVQPGIAMPQVNVVQNSTNGQSCFSVSGDRVYTASGAPYDFPATSIATSQVIQTLPGSNYPDAIQCVWNGLVVGGIDGYYAAVDIYVYDGPSGVGLGQLSSSGPPGLYRDLLSRGMAVSADGTVVISAWANQPGTVNAAGVFFQALPAPPTS